MLFYTKHIFDTSYSYKNTNYKKSTTFYNKNHILAKAPSKNNSTKTNLDTNCIPCQHIIGYV